MSCKYCNPNNGTDGAEILFEREHEDMRIIMDTRGLTGVFIDTVIGRACLGEMQFAYCPMCGDSLGEQEALTLAELREMDGRPVWVEDLCVASCSEWHLVRKHGCHGMIAVDGRHEATGAHAVIAYYDIQNGTNYGKTWLAYRRPPEEGAP